MIPFNQPYLTGKETAYILEAVACKKLSGNGKFTNLCQNLLQEKYGFHKCLLTTSCTDALEMAAILLNIEPGDEVIMPSYTFVSTANAFVLRGAKIVFADSNEGDPNIAEDTIEALITSKTKAIVVVHYAGMACNMDTIMDIAELHNLFVIEDAAQAIDSYFISNDGTKRALGSIGHMAAFSFHETKNIISGEGGMLVVNDPQFEKRAEIIWEKGTNRSAFFKGEVDKYNWVDIGSSFLPSEIIAAFLFAQLEHIEAIQSKRKEIWIRYFVGLQDLEEKQYFDLPLIPPHATNNAHMFYVICKSANDKEELVSHLQSRGIPALFHYLSLHKSPFYKDIHDGRTLTFCDLYAERLLRLPMFFELDMRDQEKIINSIVEYFACQKMKDAV